MMFKAGRLCIYQVSWWLSGWRRGLLSCVFGNSDVVGTLEYRGIHHA